VPRLEGFRRHGEWTQWPPQLVAVAGGALHGRRIAIDPEGGGDDPAGTAPGGTRASALNLEVSRALAAMLTAAGAEVMLTREGDQAVSELGRVQVSEGFRAERYCASGTRTRRPWPGITSTAPPAGAGRNVSRARSTSSGCRYRRVGESAKYALAQVSAAAVYATLARTDSSEADLLAPGRLRAEAFALFLALARDLAGAPAANGGAADDGLALSAAAAAWPVDSLLVRDAAGVPVAGAAIRLGAALVIATDARGTARFARTEAGALPVEVEDARARVRTVLLDSDRGRILESGRTPR
jgi:hypothetical protein